MEVEVVIPRLKNCPGRRTKFPPIEPEPATWIEKGLRMLGKADSVCLLDFSGYSIDFQSKSPTRFLLLREYRMSSHKHLDKLLKLFSKNEHHKLKKICEMMNKLDNELDIVFTPTKHSVSDFESKPDLKNLVYVNNLTFDDEELSYLSQTRNPWPGDLDGALWDSEDKRIAALLEYKTHNLDTEIKKEGTSNYGNEDYRRFMVLRMLRDYINKKQVLDTNILFIVWGSNPGNPHHSKIKIEKVDTQEWILLPRPKKLEPKTVKSFIVKIMEMI